jgi:hypothetical protein
MAFYYQMIYLPETDKQVRHCLQLCYQVYNGQYVQQCSNNTYSVHNEVLMSHQARLSYLLASYGRLPRSTVGN